MTPCMRVENSLVSIQLATTFDLLYISQSHNMDGECGVICSLQCEISSVSVTGLGCDRGGELFLRCHVPAGGGKAIQIDSRAAAAEPAGDGGAVVSWRDVASLSCDGSPACVRELVERRSVVFEVRRRRRRRRRAAALRRLVGSELVGRAEVAWRDAGVDDGEAVERQVVLAARGGGGGRAVRGEVPVLSVRMTVRVSETAAPAGGRRRVDGSASAANWESGGEWSVGDADVFGLAVCAADGALE